MAKTRKNSDKRGKTDIKKKKYNNNVYSSAGSSRYPLRLRDSTWFSSQPVATPCPFALYRRTYDDNVSLNVRWRRIIERAKRKITENREKNDGIKRKRRKSKVRNNMAMTSSFARLYKQPLLNWNLKNQDAKTTEEMQSRFLKRTIQETHTHTWITYKYIIYIVYIEKNKLK